MSIVDRLDADLAELDAADLRRRRRIIESRHGTEVVVDGRRAIHFCSNDYLGLADEPALTEAAIAGARRWGVGAGASHLVSGHFAIHEAAEARLAAYVGCESALLFSTGYMANLAVISALAGRGERVVLDRLCHASLIDGARLSGATLVRYAHAAADEAARLVDADPEHTVLLATDGVFSMDGDLAPLPELSRCARARRLWLLVDDAHGLGVIGANGGGVLEHFGLGSDAVPVLVGTLGKAFGSFGAFVAGSAAVIELLIQKARTYRYTTALPEPVAAATRAALALIGQESGRRERLASLVTRFRAAAHAAGVPLGSSTTPIQPVLLGSPAAALAAQRHLAAAGYWVVAIRPPTVPVGSARLRITLSAEHTEAQVDALAAELGAALARGAREA